MKRKIVEIDREKCNGCGLCVNACHEGAIEIRDGKAVLISDEYCDGLGNCLPECPTGAIKIIEREAAEYNEEAVKIKQALQNAHSDHVHAHFSGCPGSMARTIERKGDNSDNEPPKAVGHSCPGGRESSIGMNNACQCAENAGSDGPVASELNQWPIQMRLINPNAGYLKGADVLVAADCTAYAYGNFHRDFIKGRIVIIACPKLDDNQYNVGKLTEILKNGNIRSITVVRMEVPCCGGIVQAVKTAVLQSGEIVPYHEVIIGIDGTIVESR